MFLKHTSSSFCNSRFLRVPHIDRDIHLAYMYTLLKLEISEIGYLLLPSRDMAERLLQ